MAKQIKTIQCPQCGSAQQSRIKDDHYKCGSCGAEYFLDNDDININVNHRDAAPTFDINRMKWGIIVVAVIIGISIISSIISSLNKGSKTSYSTYSTIPSLKKEIPKKAYTESIKLYTLSNTGSSVMFYISERSHEREDKDEKDGFYAVFFDYIENKVIKEEKLSQEFKIGNNFEYSYLPAVDKQFVIVNKRQIYELEFKNYSFRDVSVELLANHTEFSSGIASAKFIYQPRGEGFVLMSNMGKEFYFVPSFNKLYKEDDFYNAASTGMRGIGADAVNKIYYVFSTTSSDYPEEDIMLLKIIYKYNNGGPEDKADRPSWRKQYPYSGIIYSNTPFKKILLDKDRARVVSYEDVTPGRIYFSPKVISEEHDNKLLITFKPTIAPDEKTQIQLLNLETKEPIWTVTTAERLDNKQAINTDKHYVIAVNSSTLLKIDHNGENMEAVTVDRKREY